MPAAYSKTKRKYLVSGAKKALTKDEIAKIHEMLKENLAPTTIALKLGRSQALVDRVIGEVYLKQVREG